VDERYSRYVSQIAPIEIDDIAERGVIPAKRIDSLPVRASMNGDAVVPLHPVRTRVVAVLDRLLAPQHQTIWMR